MTASKTHEYRLDQSDIRMGYPPIAAWIVDEHPAAATPCWATPRPPVTVAEQARRRALDDEFMHNLAAAKPLGKPMLVTRAQVHEAAMTFKIAVSERFGHDDAVAEVRAILGNMPLSVFPDSDLYELKKIFDDGLRELHATSR